MLELLCQVCVFVPTALGHGVHGHEGASMRHLESTAELLFPFGPRLNAILAGTYIMASVVASSVLLPATGMRLDNPMFLAVMVSFAFGGLMGDVFLHLLPEIFGSGNHGAIPTLTSSASGMASANEQQAPAARGLAAFVFLGFVLFLALDKGLRLASGQHDADGPQLHTHSHSLSPAALHTSSPADFSRHANADGLKRRKAGKRKPSEPTADKKKLQKPAASTFLRTANYLNIATGFIHNFIDGITLATSFYTSKSMGITNAVAILMHEIPHELGDAALFISSGLSIAHTITCQLIALLGCLAGVCAGCLMNEMSAADLRKMVLLSDLVFDAASANLHLFGVPLRRSFLPITAGGFLYMGAVGIVPELLRTSFPNNPRREAKKCLLQLLAISAGIFIMASMNH